MHFSKRSAITLATVAVLGLIAAGCGSSNDNNASGSGKAGTIALLLPETKTTRYETQDMPTFKAKVQSLCSDCKVDYQNANQDANKQLNQLQAALTNGAKVVVLDPVDAASAATMVQLAKQQNVPVISYDRLIQNAEVPYYISFDNFQVGKLQGTSLLGALEANGTTDKGSVVMINGSPTDPNAASFKQGALSALQGKVKLGATYDTPDWSPDKAQSEMDQAITALGKNNIVGVYAANDGTAGGAYASMQAAGMSPIPPLTGQDAEVQAIQRILVGQQYMTVYKAIKPEAEAAATMAVQLLKNQSVAVEGQTFTTVKNPNAEVKAILLNPVAVTKDNVNSTVIADGFVSASDVCTAQYQSACAAAGIS